MIICLRTIIVDLPIGICGVLVSLSLPNVRFSNTLNLLKIVTVITNRNQLGSNMLYLGMLLSFFFIRRRKRNVIFHKDM